MKNATSKSSMLLKEDRKIISRAIMVTKIQKKPLFKIETLETKKIIKICGIGTQNQQICATSFTFILLSPWKEKRNTKTRNPILLLIEIWRRGPQREHLPGDQCGPPRHTHGSLHGASHMSTPIHTNNSWQLNLRTFRALVQNYQLVPI